MRAGLVATLAAVLSAGFVTLSFRATRRERAAAAVGRGEKAPGSGVPARAAATRSDPDQFRRAANVVFSLTQGLAPFLAAATGVGVDISTRASQGEPTAIEPAGYAFGIWAYIYPACVAYAVYQALPSQRESELLRRVGNFTASAFLGGTVWAVVAQFVPDEWLWLTVVVIVWMLASLAGAFARLTEYDGPLSKVDRALVAVPISVYTGWITVATFANTSVFKNSGFDNFGLSDGAWSTLLIAAAGVLGTLATRASDGNPWYAATLVWALAGIVVTNVFERPNSTVAVAAGATAGLVVLALLDGRRRAGRA